MTRLYLFLAIGLSIIACSDPSETIQPNTHKLPRNVTKLESLLPQSEDVVKLQIYWKLYKGYRANSPEKAFTALEQQLTLADNVNNYTFQGLAYSGKGAVHWMQDNYNQSTRSYLKAIDIFEKAKDYGRAADSYNEIGTSFMQIGGNKDAITYFEKASGYYKSSNDYGFLVRTMINMAMCHANRLEYQKAYNILSNTIEIQNTHNPSDYYELCLLHSKMGITSFKAKNYPKAVNSYRNALGFAEMADVGLMKKDLFYNIAESYMYWGEDHYTEASQWIEGAKKLSEAMPADEQTAAMRLNIAGELQQREGNHIEALKTLEKAVSLANKEVVNQPLQETLSLIQNSYEIMVNRGGVVSAKSVLAYEAIEDKQAALKEELSKNMDNEGLVKALQKEIALHEEAKATLSASRMSDIALQATGLLFLFGLIGFVAYRKQSSQVSHLNNSLQQVSEDLEKETKYAHRTYGIMREIAERISEAQRDIDSSEDPVIPSKPPSMGGKVPKGL